MIAHDDLQAKVINEDFELVLIIIIGNGLIAELFISLEKARDGVVQIALGACCHDQCCFPEVLECGIECAKNVGQWTAKKGEANSQYGTMWICNIDLEENKKISKDDIIPEGWVKGRNKWKPKYKRKEYPINNALNVIKILEVAV